MKIKLDPGAYMPERAHENDAGLDLRATETKWIYAGKHEIFDTGVHVEIPSGCVGLLTSKSGLMKNHGITSRGTIDCGYTGSIKAILFNHSETGYLVHEGDKITQLVVLPIKAENIELVPELEETERGAGAFGSSGK